LNGRLCRTIGLQESRAVAQKPRDAVVNFFIEIYSGIARSSLR